MDFELSEMYAGIRPSWLQQARQKSWVRKAFLGMRSEVDRIR